MNLESITNEIIELNNKIQELEQLREDELKKEEHWHMTRYPLILESNNFWKSKILTIESSHINYLDAKNKNKKKKEVFSVTVEDKSMYNEVNITLTLVKAKQLSNYLLKVINYMEDK